MNRLQKPREIPLKILVLELDIINNSRISILFPSRLIIPINTDNDHEMSILIPISSMLHTDISTLAGRRCALGGRAYICVRMTSYLSRSLVSSVVVIANSLAGSQRAASVPPQMSYIGAARTRTVACRDGAPRVPR